MAGNIRVGKSFFECFCSDKDTAVFCKISIKDDQVHYDYDNIKIKDQPGNGTGFSIMVCRDPGHSAIFSLLKYGLLEYDCCSSETSVLQITVMRVTDTMPMSKYVKIFDRDGNQLNEWVNIYGNVTK